MRKWTVIGFVATAIVAIVLPLYVLNEGNRMAEAQTTLLTDSIAHGEIIYAENCVICHGADGLGISAYPGLNNGGVQTMDYDTLFKTIERGRYNTAMAAWSVNEGGVLNNMDIDQLIAMIQHGDWKSTAHTVDRMDLMPPTVISVEISDDILTDLAGLPHGDTIANALPIYAANCIGCHGVEAEGTGIAPALNDPAVREKGDVELARIITNGVPGTLMAGWNQALMSEQISELAGLIRYWGEIPTGLIPQPELPTIASSDADVISAGGQLYSVACSHCHGSDGQGTRMAPALNVQSFLTETNDQAIKAIIANGIPNTRMPAWGGRLSDVELNRLVSFLRAWEPTAPAVAQPSGGMMGGGPPWMRNTQ